MKSEKQPIDEIQEMNYIHCTKVKEHDRELVNLVCLQPKCLIQSNFLCCCMCVESHTTHIMKPLKSIINQAQQQAKLLKPTNHDNKNIQNTIKNLQQKTIQTFNDFKQQTLSNLQIIQKQINRFFQVKMQQSKDQNWNPTTIVENAIKIIPKITDIKTLQKQIMKLIEMITLHHNQVKKITIPEKSFIKNLQSFNQSLIKIIQENKKQLKNKFQLYQKRLQDFIDESLMLQTFKFSKTMKHKDIQLITNQHAILTNKQIFGMPNYSPPSFFQFALLTPNIKHSNIFLFQIENNQNQIGIGICSNRVLAQNYYAYPYEQFFYTSSYTNTNTGMLFGRNQANPRSSLTLPINEFCGYLLFNDGSTYPKNKNSFQKINLSQFRLSLFRWVMLQLYLQTWIKKH